MVVGVCLFKEGMIGVWISERVFWGFLNFGGFEFVCKAVLVVYVFRHEGNLVEFINKWTLRHIGHVRQL
ncbi:hypothetical protein Hanom_Chr17g01546341 [Helianthus anomalus]